VANVVMVGFFSGATGLISPQAGEQAIRNTLRPRLVDLNLKAFNAGYDYAKKQEAS
jgi:2-oxoglutarate ferredoxin oxidoreductase subunit gamma